MDVHTPLQRSYNMSQIKCKDTKPEILIRKWLFAQGFRYRLHSKYLPGKPDIVFTTKKIAIYVHGCFWHKHRCKYFKWPETNKEFWVEKITANVNRDKKNYLKLKKMGWKYIILWECNIDNRFQETCKYINRVIHAAKLERDQT